MFKIGLDRKEVIFIIVSLLIKTNVIVEDMDLTK